MAACFPALISYRAELSSAPTTTFWLRNEVVLVAVVAHRDGQVLLAGPQAERQLVEVELAHGREQLLPRDLIGTSTWRMGESPPLVSRAATSSQSLPS